MCLVVRGVRCLVALPGGAAWLMIRSVIVAHTGREGVKFRYDFSQTISMASFLAWMFNRLRPPSLGGRHRKSRAILGDESFSHMNFLIILVRAVSIEGGIPCALARNWVRPPTIAWTMVFFPKRVGLFLPHRSRSFLMRSNIGSQGAVAFVRFPIHAPRERIASPSVAMWTWSFTGVISS